MLNYPKGHLRYLDVSRVSRGYPFCLWQAGLKIRLTLENPFDPVPEAWGSHFLTYFLGISLEVFARPGR